jgi:sialic acid synthase SpsE
VRPRRNRLRLRAVSLEALERLERIGVARYKIGSGEVTNLELIRTVAAAGKPVLVSSGMSTWEELDAAVGFSDRSLGTYAAFAAVA